MSDQINKELEDPFADFSNQNFEVDPESLMDFVIAVVDTSDYKGILSVKKLQKVVKEG